MSSFLNFAPWSFRRVFTTQRGVVKSTFTTPNAKHSTKKISKKQMISNVFFSPFLPLIHMLLKFLVGRRNKTNTAYGKSK